MGFISKLLGWDKETNDFNSSGLDLDDLDSEYDSNSLDNSLSSSGGMDDFGSSQQGLNSSSNFESNFNNDPFSTNPQKNTDSGSDFRYGDMSNRPNAKKQNHSDYSDFDTKDLRIVLEKLDTIKSSVNSLHHRLDKLENKKRRW